MKHLKEQPKSEHELELAGPFFAVLFVLMLIGFLVPLRPEYSDRERRKLHEFPVFSVQSLLDGSYFDEISAWYSDSFPGREDMLEISDRLDTLHGIGKNEVQLTQLTGSGSDSAQLDALLEEAEADAVSAGEGNTPAPAEITAVTPKPAAAASLSPTPEPEESAEPVDPDAVIENWEGLDGEEEAKMFGDLVVIDGNAVSRMGFDQTVTDHHIQLMNQAGDALAEKGIRFFNLPIPTSVSVLLSSDMLEEIGAADQGKILRYMFAKENEHVGKVNAFNNLLAHNKEYLYFHGDHHWTALGAYYAYQSFCETAGFEPVPLSEYEEKNMGEFLGTHAYSVSKNLLEPDEMIAYIPPGSIKMEITGKEPFDGVIVDESANYPNMKYNCFINGDNPVTVITNEDLPDAPDCLVIKDSFGNPFVVYLTQHYHRVIVLDYRKNFTPVSKLAEEYGVQDVILAQSIGVTQTRNAQFLLDNLMK
ncbi:MAG: hypothetical protein IKS55_10630 [Oscillospiraceae bacterium]|nr:hypothetical protein [Oscillospiraceae bacterium]